MASGRLPGDFWPRVPGWSGPGEASDEESFEIEEVDESIEVDKEEVTDKSPGSPGAKKVTTMKRPAARKNATKEKKKAAADDNLMSPEKKKGRPAKTAKASMMKKPSAASRATKTVKPGAPRKKAEKPRDGYAGCGKCRNYGCAKCIEKKDEDADMDGVSANNGGRA